MTDKEQIEAIRAEVSLAAPGVLSGFEFLLAQLDKRDEVLRDYAGTQQRIIDVCGNLNDWNCLCDLGHAARVALGEE